MIKQTKMSSKLLLLVATVVLLGILTACGTQGATSDEPSPLDVTATDVAPTPIPPVPTLALAATATLETAATDLSTPTATQVFGEPTPTALVPAKSTLADASTPEIAEATPLGGETAAELSDATATPEPEATLQSTDTSLPVSYTVQSGDTLGEIAMLFGTTVDEIISLNEQTFPGLGTNPDVLTVGWMLALPPVTFSGTIHVVEQADVLEELAVFYGTTVEAMVTLNEETYPTLRTDPGTLFIGWKLKIPAVDNI